MAFLPDVASQAALAAGVLDPTPVTHSLVLAAGAAVLLAAPLRPWGGISFGRALVLAALLVPGHVLLDLLQSPWRSPFWPLSRAPSGLPWPLLPHSATAEAMLSGFAFLGILAVRRMRGRPVAAVLPARPVAVAVTALIVLLAGMTHHVRGQREDRYDDARQRLEAGDATSALRLADEADRWPWPIRPGRIDYLRAEAYLMRHDQAGAERHLQQSVRADPDYFWGWADLCLLYAERDRPADERQQDSHTCLDQLETRFAGDADLAKVTGKIERALARR
jgi:hypothetical protein